MTEEQNEEIRKLAERDASRALALGKALDAGEARELKMLKRSNGYSTMVFAIVVASAIASGCGGADSRATCVIAVAALAALAFMRSRDRAAG